MCVGQACAGRIERECAAGKRYSVWIEHFRPEDRPDDKLQKLRLRDRGGYKAEGWICEPDFSPPSRPEDFGKRPREEKEWVVPDRPQSQIEEGTWRQPPTNRQQQAPRRALNSVVNRLAAADGGSPLAEDLKGQVQAAVEARVQAEQADNTVEVDGEQLNITELLAKYKRVKEERQQSTARGLIRAESWAADAHLGGLGARPDGASKLGGVWVRAGDDAALLPVRHQDLPRACERGPKAPCRGNGRRRLQGPEAARGRPRASEEGGWAEEGCAARLERIGRWRNQAEGPSQGRFRSKPAAAAHGGRRQAES